MPQGLQGIGEGPGSRLRGRWLGFQASLCSCPEEVKGREAAGNGNVCPETELRLRHPRLPLSLIKHSLVFLHKMDSKPAPPNAPSLGWVNTWGCLQASACEAPLGKGSSHPSPSGSSAGGGGGGGPPGAGVACAGERDVLCHLWVSGGRCATHGSVFPWPPGETILPRGWGSSRALTHSHVPHQLGLGGGLGMPLGARQAGHE